MQKNYNENLVAGAAIRDDKGRRISKLFEAPHPKMTVGYAKNLIMPDTPTEQKFNFRQSGGGVIEDGVAVIDKVKGNSVVWNQLIKDFREPSNWLTGGNDVTTVGDKIHIKFASASSSNAFGVKSSAFSAGHKYCLLMNNENAMPLTAIKLGSASSVDNYGSTLKTETPAITIAIPTSSESDGALWFWPSDETKLEGDFSNIYAIDLTQMFGAGNEPSTYEEFLQRKPKVADEYAYNEGTIVNNKVEKVVTTGRNIWDEQIRRGNYDSDTGVFISRSSENYYANVNPIKVLGGKDYYHYTSNTGPTSIIDWYDADMNFIGEVTIPKNKRIVTSPSNACFANFWMYISSGISLGEKCCINLSDPAINGKYFPYEEHTLDLAWVKDIKDADGVKLFEDGMKSAGTAFDEAAKGKAIKRIGVYTFNGTENWIINPYAQNNGVMAYQCYDRFNPINYNIRCDRFVTRHWGILTPMTIFAIPKDGIIIETDGTQSLADFKASLEAKPLDVYYELAEPIEVEYDEKSLTYPVVAGGTEEAIASEPSSAFRADIGYGIDAVKTILDLKARVEALEGK